MVAKLGLVCHSRPTIPTSSPAKTISLCLGTHMQWQPFATEAWRRWPAGGRGSEWGKVFCDLCVCIVQFSACIFLCYFCAILGPFSSREGRNVCPIWLHPPTPHLDPCTLEAPNPSSLVTFSSTFQSLADYVRGAASPHNICVYTPVVYLSPLMAVCGGCAR